MPNVAEVVPDSELQNVKWDGSSQSNSHSISEAVPDSEMQNVKWDSGQPSLKDQFRNGMQDTQGLINKASTGSLKLATGKGFQDREMSMMTPTIQPNTSRPFDANVTAASNPIARTLQIGAATAGGMQGQELDNVTSPIGLVTGLAKPAIAVAGKVGEAIEGAKNYIANLALNDAGLAQSKSAFNYDQNARRVMSSMPDVVGNDLNSTQAAVQNKMSETGQAIQSTVQNHPMANTKLDIEEQITSPFDKKIAELNQQNPQLNSTAINRLQQAKIGLLNNFDENGKAISAPNLNSMTPSQIWNFRKLKIDPMTKFTGNVSDDAVVNSAFQEARHNLKTTMNSVMPELKPLNQDYGDLSAADDSLDKLAFKTQKEGLPGFKISDLLSAGWLSNPANKIKFAQFLYTAPKEQIASLEKSVPSLPDIIKQNFIENAKFRSAPKPIVGNMGNMDAAGAGQGFAQPAVVNQPADSTRAIGGPESDMESEGTPPIQYTGPNPKGERTSIMRLREEASKNKQIAPKGK